MSDSQQDIELMRAMLDREESEDEECKGPDEDAQIAAQMYQTETNTNAPPEIMDLTGDDEPEVIQIDVVDLVGAGPAIATNDNTVEITGEDDGEPEVKLVPVTVDVTAEDVEMEARAGSADKFVFFTQQVGGVKTRQFLKMGWAKDLEDNKWITDETLFALCSWFLQVVPADCAHLFDPSVYGSYVKTKKALTAWKQVPIKIFPVCESSHWVLIVLMEEIGDSAMLVFDSKRKRSAGTEVAQSFKSCFAVKETIIVDAPKQQSDYDCGDHVIWNFFRVVRAIATNPEHQLRGILSNPKTYAGPVFTRKILIKTMIEAKADGNFDWMFWSLYNDGHGNRVWPCRLIPSSLGLFLTKKKRERGMRPIIWVDREYNNVIWRSEKLLPLREKNVDEALTMCEFGSTRRQQEFKEQLTDAYAKAIL